MVNGRGLPELSLPVTGERRLLKEMVESALGIERAATPRARTGSKDDVLGEHIN